MHGSEGRSAEPLGVGIIGTGAIGAEHARSLATRVPGASVTGVFDADAARANEVAEAVGAKAAGTADALIDDDAVEAIVVAASSRFHAPLTLAAIAAGKPVLCEKPLALTAADCVTILEAEVAAGRRLVQVGYMRRFDPGYHQVKEAVDSGRIGEPLLLHHVHRNPATPPGLTSELMLTEAVVHEIDVTRWLLDDEVVGALVFAPRSRPHEGGELLDPQFVILEMASGVVVDVEIFAATPVGYDVRCEVVGAEGVAALETPRLSSVTVAGNRHEAVPTDWGERFGITYIVELQAWVDAIRNGAPIGPSAWDGYAATAVAEAAVESQHTGRRVAVELIDRPSLYDPPAT